MSSIKNGPSEEKIQRILNWRESLMTLPTEQFFEFIRIYIGEIQSPFNKPKLIEQLSTIFRKQETKDNVLAFLSEFDLKVLTLIKLIKKPTQQKITDFFLSEYKLSDIYTELLDLNERMLIYYFKNEEDNKKIIQINPLLEDTVFPYLNINLLFSDAICIKSEIEPQFMLSPQFLAAFISYLRSYPDLCKNDGSIKKKDNERLEEIFNGKVKAIQLVLTAFFNLGILKAGEKSVFIDEIKLENFAKLKFCHQATFLCVASAVRLGRDGLRVQAQLLLDLMASLPDNNLLWTTVIRMAFIISNKFKKEEEPVQNRFSRILEARKNIDGGYSFNSENSGKIIEKILDSAIEFGLLEKYGTAENGELILKKGSLFCDYENLENNTKSSEITKKGLVNINAGTCMTIMPGLNLSEILEISNFMDIVSCNTVSEYEISRKSVSRAFDRNIEPKQIYEILEKYTAFELPQSLLMNIEEWFNSYSATRIYKGYVLKVDEKIARILENNPNVSQYIKMKLAPYVYLLNIDINESIDEFILKSGIDFMGTVRAASQVTPSIGFPLVKNGSDCINFHEFQQPKEDFKDFSKKGQAIKSYFKEKLLSMDMNEQQKDCLLSRIDRGIIVSESQLNKDNVRFEILEADGMDFSNKMRLVEKAISNKDSVEIYIPNEKNPEDMEIILGKPLSIARQMNDCLVKFHLNEIDEIRVYSLGRISKIKLIKTSVFANYGN